MGYAAVSRLLPGTKQFCDRFHYFAPDFLLQLAGYALEQICIRREQLSRTRKLVCLKLPDVKLSSVISTAPESA